MICGDFNIDRKVENVLTRMLKGNNFTQIVQKPTTYRGNCIDHFYHNIAERVKKIEHKLHYPYYSDHEAICVMIKDPWTKEEINKLNMFLKLNTPLLDLFLESKKITPLQMAPPQVS